MPKIWEPGDVIGLWELVEFDTEHKMWRVRCRCKAERFAIPIVLYQRNTLERPVGCVKCFRKYVKSHPRKRKCEYCGEVDKTKFNRTGASICMACARAKIRNGVCVQCDKIIRYSSGTRSLKKTDKCLECRGIATA